MLSAVCMDQESLLISFAALSAGAMLIATVWAILSTSSRKNENLGAVKQVRRRPISMVSRPEGAEKCSICMGVIKRELTSIECSCGSSFHQSCAIRVGLCPLCNNEIEIPQSLISLIETCETPVRSMPLMRDDRMFLLDDRFLLGDIDGETYQLLKAEILMDAPEASYCQYCGLKLYPGEECPCTREQPIRCPECGRKLDESDSFCQSCGVILSEDFSEELYQCSSCSRIVLASERICSCGALLLDPGDAVCSDCGYPVPIEADKCPNCGRVRFVELLECPACGREVSPIDFECECGAIFLDRIERIECPECGAEISLDDRFCRSCGVRFRSDSFSSLQRLL